MAPTIRATPALLLLPLMLAGCGLGPGIQPSHGEAKSEASSRLTEWDPDASKAQDLAIGTLKRWDEMKAELKAAQGFEEQCDLMSHMRDLLRQRLNTLSDLEKRYPHNPLIAEAALAANRLLLNDFRYDIPPFFTKGATPQETLSKYTSGIAYLERKVIPVLKDIRSLQ